MPPDSSYTVSLAVDDVDRDGDPDALLGIGYGGDRLYLNDGTGDFTDVSAAQMPKEGRSTSAVALADMDGDDDPDLLVAEYAQIRLYTNLTRQLAWRSLPRIGRSLQLDVYGGPREEWELALSPIHQAGGSLGSLGLPRRESGVLDGNGRGSIEFLVPYDLGLIGTSLVWRARIGPSVKRIPFGGPCEDCVREVTTLTDL
jgi:hypothetical protein